MRGAVRRLTLGVASVAAAALAAAAPAAAQRAQLESVIRRTTLPNGLEVIVVENHGVPLATVEIDVRNGAFTQTAATEGLAHMYEHMFFRASRDFPEPEQFTARAAELGAAFNGTTQEERVNYYLTLPSDNVEPGMRLIAAALRAPLFRRDELEREREVVLGEYDRAESDPFFRFTRQMERRLWTSAWPSKNTIGSRAVVGSTTPEQMRAIQRRFYVPENCALIVAGDVVPDSVFALARRVFGDWPRGGEPAGATPGAAPAPPAAASAPTGIEVPPLTRNDAVIVEEPVGAVLVMLQWQGPSVTRDAEATYAADVFSDVMNLPGSRLQRRLVDAGLFQSVTVNYYTLGHVGPITIMGETTPEKLREALAALGDEVGHLADTGYFAAAELEPVQRKRAIGTLFGLERASGFAHQLGFWWSVAGLDYYMGYVDNMARQRPEDLRAYARRYIVGRPHVTGVLLSPEVRRALGLTTADLLGPRSTP